METITEAVEAEVEEEEVEAEVEKEVEKAGHLNKASGNTRQVCQPLFACPDIPDMRRDLQLKQTIELFEGTVEKQVIEETFKLCAFDPVATHKQVSTSSESFKIHIFSFVLYQVGKS